MKTVKLTISNRIDVLDDMRVFSSIVRVAYNRYQDGMDEKEAVLRWIKTPEWVANFHQLHTGTKTAIGDIHGN